MRNETDKTGQARAGTMPGPSLAQLLRSTRAGFLSVLEHSKLRGFLRYLYGRGLLKRDLATVLISPGRRQPWSK